MTTQRITLLILLPVLALAAVVAGCGGGGASKGGAAAAPTVSGSLSVMGIWVGEEQKSFQAVIDDFRTRFPNVKVTYTPAGNNLPTVLTTAVQGGSPPDVAAPAQPGLVTSFIRQHKLKPLDFARKTTLANFGQAIVDLGTVNGKFYSLVYKADNKSTVFYNVQAYKDAGVTPPTTWDQFLADARTIKASGLPAYSIPGGEGWPLTDLFENIYLRTAGPAKYDALSRHSIPWTDPSVKRALGEMAKVLADSSNIAGGTAGALQTDFPTAVGNVLATKPKAAQIIEGDFVPGVVTSPIKPVTGYGEFTFPSIDRSPPVVVGAGNLVIAFRDTPAIRAFVNYLATPRAAEVWIKRGGFVSANKKVPPSTYSDSILRKAAQDVTQAQTFRFDMSDEQPVGFGGTPGQGEWKIFQDFLRNPRNINGTASALESAAVKAYKGS
jgi:ABC-type glycerol-3-phosphate transport system substrate-binding protein